VNILNSLVGPCHHSMERCQVADAVNASSYGGGVAANEMNCR
jgi:hypothetical protein